MPSFKTIFTLIFWLILQSGKSQCPGPSGGASNCDPLLSEIRMNTPNMVDFTFDSFSKINGGMEIFGSTQIKIITVNNPALACKWNLIMYVFNSGIPTPANAFDNLAQYGNGSGQLPTLNYIQVRVTNICGTPVNNGVWQTFAASSGSALDIINNIVLTAAGNCNTSKVNTAGSYLTNPGEYTFIIDYKILPAAGIPAFPLTPGRYSANIKFCLSEM